MELFHSAAFGTYALFAAALSIILASVDMFGGILLPRTKKQAGPEAEVSPGPGTSDTIDGYARLLAARRNALTNIIPFLLMMLLFVLLGGSRQWVTALCGVYTVMRLTHAVAHVRHLQPWRTIVWIVGQLCFFVSMFFVIRAALVIA